MIEHKNIPLDSSISKKGLFFTSHKLTQNLSNSSLTCPTGAQINGRTGMNLHCNDLEETKPTHPLTIHSPMEGRFHAATEDDHNRRLTAGDHHQALPDHQRRGDDHSEAQYLEEKLCVPQKRPD